MSLDHKIAEPSKQNILKEDAETGHLPNPKTNKLSGMLFHSTLKEIPLFLFLFETLPKLELQSWQSRIYDYNNTDGQIVIGENGKSRKPDQWPSGPPSTNTTETVGKSSFLYVRVVN